MAKSRSPNPTKLAYLCRARRIDYDDVVAVDFELEEIVLCVCGLGQIRIERSALPASVEVMPDMIEEMLPAPNTAEAQPAPGQKRA